MCLRLRSGTESNTLIERSRNHRWRNKNVPSTGSGIGSMSENVPSTGSGTESNTVIERSRNHRDDE